MNMNSIAMSFMIENEGELFSFIGTEKALSCNFDGVEVTFSLKYDFLDKPPLCLRAKAEISDKIKLVILPYRIELYVNGRLCDEEWPAGELHLDKCHVCPLDFPLTLEEYTPDMSDKPAILGEFTNAEGWKPDENVFVGDCMPYVYNGDYHILYLKDRHHHHSKWSRGAHQWEHISTSDFKNFKIHPTAVEIDSPDEGSICTGSWILNDGTHYLFYTIRSADGSPAKICRSISSDGYIYKKDREFHFTLSEKYNRVSARDPKVIRDSENRFHMFLTTALIEEGVGCLAHLTSDDLTHWKEEEEPMLISPYGAEQPECPDYFYKDGYYYLIFSLYGSAFYRYSKKPFSDWMTADEPRIPCETVPKGAVWNDRLIFTGYRGDGKYGGTMTFLEAVVQKNGELSYKPLD